MKYIGETGRYAKERFKEHIGYVENKQLEKPTKHKGMNKLS